MRFMIAGLAAITLATMAVAAENNKTVIIQEGKTPVLTLTVPPTAETLPWKGKTTIRMADMTVHVWPIAGAADVAAGVARVADVIKGDVLEFKPAVTVEIILCGGPARQMTGPGKEADDGDAGRAEVIIFGVGGRIFAACIHGEDAITPARHAALLALLQTAEPPNPGTTGTLPEVEVIGHQLNESKPIWPTGQPEWTSARRFPTTRVYIQQPPWGYGLEQWCRADVPRGGGKAKYEFKEEFEVGLPHRFQLDLYEKTKTLNGTLRHCATQVELRYALADWGVIPLNPTLYGEWSFVDPKFGDDAYELKLLFGDDFCDRWHWGFNLICEQEIAGAETRELSATQSISYTLVDNKLSIGIEAKYASETEKGARHPAPNEFDIGPSLQWRPTANTFVDVAPLFGVTQDSPMLECWIVFGVDFGPGHSQKSKSDNAPISSRSH